MIIENFKNQFSKLNWEYADSLFIYAKEKQLVSSEVLLALPRIVFNAHSLLLFTKDEIIIVGQGKWFKKNKWVLKLKRNLEFIFLEKKKDTTSLNISLLHKDQNNLETIVSVSLEFLDEYIDSIKKYIFIENTIAIDKDKQEDITIYNLKGRYQIVDNQIFISCIKSGNVWLNKLTKDNVSKVTFEKDLNQLQINLKSNNNLLIKGLESNINNIYKEITKWLQ